MSKSNDRSEGGIGVCGTCFIVFLILKLVGSVAWSWWWVTAPLWLPVAAVVAGCLVIVCGACAVKLVRGR